MAAVTHNDDPGSPASGLGDSTGGVMGAGGDEPHHRRARRSSRAPRSLVAVGLVVGTVFAGPLAYLAWRVTTGEDALAALGSTDVRGALTRTLALGLSVATSAALVGTALAWCTTRTDLPARRLFAVLAPLPLVFPSFVGAIALRSAVAPGGLLPSLLAPLGVEEVPVIDGFWGSWLVLTLFTYPLVLLPVAARLRVLPPSLEESARLLGRGAGTTFTSIVVPQIRTAVSAGALLVFLYVLSDFGVVQIMRTDTLTRIIYENRLARPETAQAAALLVGLLAVATVVIERGLHRRAPLRGPARGHQALQVPLGRWRWPALGAIVVFFANALAGPLLSLGHWVRRDLADDPAALSTLGTWMGDLTAPATNTALAGIVAAAVALALVLPVAYLTARFGNRSGRVADALVTAGYALPGIAIALALVFWTLNVPGLDALYQTFVVLVAAYVVHFGAQAMGAAQVAVAAVPTNLDEAGRLLGARRLRRVMTVDLPLMRGGLVAGGGLVMLSVMKELPATLLLAPTGFDTLATEIWQAQEFHSFARMGLASLVLVAVSGVLTWLLVVRRADALD